MEEFSTVCFAVSNQSTRSVMVPERGMARGYNVSRYLPKDFGIHGNDGKVRYTVLTLASYSVYDCLNRKFRAISSMASHLGHHDSCLKTSDM